ncbi:LuxR C-terminal-related transcriptional regulator [Blastococcus sp. URHD0036]|uniref:LuxR C-terminal-related transcriptional regulator n=1 Tax=Blastococcus sp. URHD0036 TaxID=1380356 RepID=UPI0012DE4E1B|nr:LuxR C-terminal-related transcriptional regulator [Blastococcus sp. URHD0036]
MRESKLRRPRLSGSVIDRTWLFDRPVVPMPDPDGTPGTASEPTDTVVTLVSAPPGAGKTTLLARWARHRTALGEAVAWLTLDREDNDRALFWTGLFGAVQTAIASSGADPVVPSDQAPDEPRRPRLVEFDRLLAAARTPVWLLLDDVQELRSPEVLADLEALLGQLPDGLHPVLASRRDPVLGLHRLRLSGRLREIRVGDLALDREEVRRVLAHHGVVLGETELSTVVDRTEGWAAGVRMAALALAGAEDPHGVVREFAGDDRAVADYLAAEVLARLGEREHRLLRSCAVPEQLTPELAVALTEDPSATDLLEDLYRDNVLVVRLGTPGGWYRIHPLLRGYLVAEMRRSDPGALAAAHRRTATWFAEHGESAWAVDHAVRSGDDELAVELLTATGPRLLADGRAGALHTVIGTGTEAVRADSGVRRLDDLARLELGESTGVPAPRRPVHDSLPAAPEPADGTDPGAEEPLDALVALHHARHDLAASAAALAASAAARPEGDGDLALLVGLNRGIVLLMTGRLDEAEVELADAAALAVRSGNAYAALRAGAYRTALVAARGQFRQVWALAQETITRGRETGLLGTLEIAGTMLLAAHSARQQLQAPVARGLAQQAAALMDGAGDLDTLLSSRALLALLDVEDGADPLEGCRRLRAVWDAAGGQSLSAPLVVHLAVNEHRCAWLAGRLDWAREAQARLEPLGPVGEAAVLATTEHLARGRWEAARHRLAPVLDGSTPCLMPLGLQQARLLEALLAEQAGQSARSLDALRTALQMGADSGALRVFLDVPGVDRLLDDNADRFGRLDGVAGQIRAAARGRADHAVVPITPRELTVLTDLPAQLTLEEIAARHQVSVNTVKTHVRSIYQKLGAANRRDAVATARRWGLL